MSGAAAPAHRPAPPVWPIVLTARATASECTPALLVAASLAAPGAFDDMQRHRARLRAIVTRHSVARVAGSNNHGWSHTAAAWSVKAIPGWRALTPAALDVAIRRRLRHDPPRAVEVVERRRVAPGQTRVRLALTAPEVAWCALTTLSTAERVGCAAWAWALWALLRLTRRRRLDVLIAQRRAARMRRGEGVPRAA